MTSGSTPTTNDYKLAELEKGSRVEVALNEWRIGHREGHVRDMIGGRHDVSTDFRVSASPRERVKGSLGLAVRKDKEGDQEKSKYDRDTSRSFKFWEGSCLQFGYTDPTWSFFLQGEPVPSNSASLYGRHIKWRSASHCARVGTLHAERFRMISSDPSRRPAERLNVYHIPDPSSVSNKLGGPGMLVHKHARAKAFALYRSHGLYPRRADQSIPSAHTFQARGSLPQSQGILLAPKDVLTQFTNTHSTRYLEEHGLLSESSPFSRNAQDERRTASSGDVLTSVTSGYMPPGLLQAQHSSDITSTTGMLPDAPSSEASSIDAEDDDQDRPHDRRKILAEAFGTLDQPTLERLRQAGALNDRGSNWFSRHFRGPLTSRVQGDDLILTSASPPWLALAPRPLQEAQARRFIDTGRLRTSKVDVNARVKQQRYGQLAGLLAHVPEDSLCMLLPLWPAETDPESARMFPDEHAQEPPSEERLYLFVYLVPFGVQDENGSSTKSWLGTLGIERKRKHERAKRDSGATVVFGSFRVVAQLMTYDDLKGSNLRLPVHGLSVTGSLAEAQRNIPLASLRETYKDDFAIAICADGRSGNIDLLPDGLAKLGLCADDPDDVRWKQDKLLDGRQLEQMPDLKLTVIGRAVAEMVWLACMASVSFGDV